MTANETLYIIVVKKQKQKTNQLQPRPPGFVTKTMVIVVPYHWLFFPLLACTLTGNFSNICLGSNKFHFYLI